MNTNENKNILSIHPEKLAFDDVAKRLFLRWCEINDSIRPEYIERDEYDPSNVLVDGENGVKILKIPVDASSAELLPMIRAVDQDTFSENETRASHGSNKMINFGQMMMDAGSFLADRLDSVKDQPSDNPDVISARETATRLATEFYEFGATLSGEDTPEVDLGTIANRKLSKKQNECVGRFLVGDKLYESRIKKAGDDPVAIEAVRKKTQDQFFRVVSKATELQSRDSDGTERGKSAHDAFLDKIQKSLLDNVTDMPNKELTSAIFRRGMDKVLNGMEAVSNGLENKLRNGVVNFFDNIRKAGYDDENHRLIVDKLDMPSQKHELDKLKQQAVETGDWSLVGQKEKKITDAIQSEVSRLKYEEDMNNPSEMILAQTRNCVGASILGGALLEEAGIDYLVAQLPEHSLLLVVTSDNKLLWRDMQSSEPNHELKEGIMLPIDGQVPPTLDSISSVVKTSKGSVSFRHKGSMLRGVSKNTPITLLPPKSGQECQVWGNFGNYLSDSEDYQLSIKAIEKALAIDPNDFGLWSAIGNNLIGLKNYPGAIEAYHRVLAFDPDNADAWNDIGYCQDKLGDYHSAVDAFRKALAINPDDPISWSNLGEALNNSGDYQGAIEACNKALAINPDDAETWCYLGSSLNNFGYQMDAIKALEKASELAKVKGDEEELLNTIEKKLAEINQKG